MIKDGNYIVIQSFMVSDLQLKGNELLIYAIIYGFSQAENQAFTGSLQYLMDWTGASRPTVIHSLKSLVDKGYLEKREQLINGLKLCEYRVVKKFNHQLKNLTRVVKKLNRGSKETLQGGSKETLHNNIYLNNLNNNIDINNSQFDNEFDEIWEIYPRKQGKSTALKAYIKAIQSGVEYQDIKQGVERYVEYIRNNNIEQRFIKQGSTWFNQQCWNDEYTVKKKTSYNINEINKIDTLDFVK